MVSKCLNIAKNLRRGGSIHPLLYHSWGGGGGELCVHVVCAFKGYSVKGFKNELLQGQMINILVTFLSQLLECLTQPRQ